MRLATLALLASSPLWGSLDPGPYRAGYRIVVYEDGSRLDGPKSGPFADPAGPRPRRLAVHVWYPVRPDAAGSPLTLSDYAAYNHLNRRPDGSPSDTERRGGETTLRNIVSSRYRALTDTEWGTLRSARAAALYEPPPAPGRFPLLIGTLRPVSTAITSEYLATHGYVVAFVRTEGALNETWDADTHMRDMEVAADRLRQDPNVDPGRTGAIGFSGSGFSQVLLAMRNAHVDALVDIESAIFAKGFYERLSRSSAYSPVALRAAFLHIYGRELAANPQFPEDHIQDFRDMKHSERVRLVLDQPGLDHWDVATEGMATATVLTIRGEKAGGVRRTFEAATVYTRRFLDAHLKDDAAAREWLKQPPAAHGLGDVVTVESLPAVPAAPTAADLDRLIETRGPQAAVAALKAAPSGRALPENVLNRLGYRVLERGDAEGAVAVLALAAESHPASANAQDSLAEALEAAGRRDEAIAASRRVLELLGQQAPNDALRRANEERLRRLARP